MLDLKGKNILVTGGAGFIGSHLVDKLIVEGVKNIIVVDNFFLGKMENLKDAQKNSKNVMIYNHDAQDYKFMAEKIREHKINIIYNLATKALPYSFVDPEDAFMVNVEIAQTLLRLLREKEYETLIHFSTSEVYGSEVNGAISETHNYGAKTPYAAGKAGADLMIQSYLNLFNLDIAIVRPFNNYGPRQNEGAYAGVIPFTIKRILNGQSPIIEGTGEQSRDFIYVKDTVDSAIEIYKNKDTRGKILNIASGNNIKIKDIIEKISNIMDYHGDIEKKSERLGDVFKHCANISLAKELISFNPSTNLEIGLNETIQWYKNQKK
jgi:UDP-glucose 4-epimerase